MTRAADEALAWAREHIPSDPHDVVNAMARAGWVGAGGRDGRYIRMYRPGEPEWHVLVPLNPDYPDYPDLMAALLAELKQAAGAGRAARQVVCELTAPPERPSVDLPALYSALDCLKSTLVTSARDWSRSEDGVILWAVLMGWGDPDPKSADHDPDDPDGLKRHASRFGWDESFVERIREMRAAVEAFDINAIGDLLHAVAESKVEG